MSHIFTNDMSEEIEKRLRPSGNERGWTLDWEREAMVGSISWRAKDQEVKGQ